MQRIKKGDTVEIIAGKDLGEQGEVIAILTKDNRVIVNGVNKLKKHEKARQVGSRQIPAQIVEFDSPIHQSNVMVVCKSCGKKTRISFRERENFGKVRYCKKCNADID
jgi:large subunit ribosomal protein L24